jgi:IMP cyclohydrolase
MELLNLSELLKNNSYPGRGIVIGKSADGKNMVIAYFIMGRSENSRNRIFIPDGEGIKTKAYDESKLVDPSLIIYSPVRVIDGKTIVTNGDQTDTVYDFIKEGKTFEEALRTRQFEPDAPNYTPRISGIIEGDFYKMSILKSADGDPSSDHRYFYEYSNGKAGYGHFIHTYKCDGNPIPSFEGEPEPVEIKGDINSFTEDVWNSLNEDNKVSLFVRFIDLDTGLYQTKIMNKNF